MNENFIGAVCKLLYGFFAAFRLDFDGKFHLYLVFAGLICKDRNLYLLHMAKNIFAFSHCCPTKKHENRIAPHISRLGKAFPFLMEQQ